MEPTREQVEASPWEGEAKDGPPELERFQQECVEALLQTFGSLALEHDFDQLCRRIVEEGRRILGLDRIGLWFVTEEGKFIIGSFGTDEQGNLRDERSRRLDVLPDSRPEHLIHRTDQFLLQKDIPLLDDTGRVVGQGWHVTVPLSSEGTVLGLIFADNLLSQRPIDGRQVDLLRLYGAMVGQLCQRMRAEEALQARERYLQALTQVAQILITAGDEIPYGPVLEVLGHAARADRVYVFLNHRAETGELLTSQVAEWCAEGVTPQIDNPELQNFPWEARGFGRWIEIMSRGEAVNGLVADFPPPEREMFERQDIQAMLCLPLQVDGEWIGFIGFDNCHQARLWDPSEVHFLHTAATNLTARLDRLRVRAEREGLSRLARRLAGAASVAAIAAVVREETERILSVGGSGAFFRPGGKPASGWDAYYFAARRPDQDTFDVAEFVDTIAGQKQIFPQESWSAADLSPMVQSILAGQPVLINRTPGQEEPILKRFGDKERLSASLMHVPVRRGEQTIGLLSAQSYTPWRYNEADLSLLQRIADAVAPALERAFAEAARWESQERYRLLFEQSPIGVFHYDPQLRLTDFNERFVELLQSTRERLMGLDLNALQDQRVLPAIRQALAGEVGFYEGSYRATTSSAEIWASMWTAPLRDAQGHLQGGMGLVEDLTERHRLEEQLRQAQKLEALGTFAGGLAHHFNNLLMVILGNVELAELGAPEELHRYLGVAREHVHRAADLVQQLILVARQSQPDRRPLNAGPLVEETARQLGPELDPQIEVQVRVAPDLWPVRADARQIQQVLLNLAHNARDAIRDCLEGPAAKPGRLPGLPFTLTLTAENVTVGGLDPLDHPEARPGQFVRLSVTDDGIGMDAETQQHLFEPFFTTRPVGQGTGLGLATVRGIVEQHEGWITIHSELGRGTTVQVYLPRHVAEVEREKKEELPRGTETILLVDDVDLIRELGRTFLEHLGYTVLLAQDGREGLEIYARERDRIDLVILDLVMPRLSGQEALQMIRMLNPTAKVLISSGSDEEVDGPQCLRLGAVGFVAKPYHLADMAQAVRAALDQPTA